MPAANLFEAGRLARFAEASRVFGEIIISSDEPLLGWREFQDYDRAALQKRSKFLLWASAALGDGILVPMGFEYGLDGRLARPVDDAKSWFELAAERPFDLSEDIAAANAFVASQSGQFKPLAAAPLWPAGAGKILAAIRRSGDKTGIRVVLANPAMDRDLSLPASSVSREVGEFLPLKDALRPGPNLVPDDMLTLRAGEVRILEGHRAAVIRSSEALVPADGGCIGASSRHRGGGAMRRRRPPSGQADRRRRGSYRMRRLRRRGMIRSPSRSCGALQTRPFGARSG